MNSPFTPTRCPFDSMPVALTRERERISPRTPIVLDVSASTKSATPISSYASWPSLRCVKCSFSSVVMPGRDVSERSPTCERIQMFGWAPARAQPTARTTGLLGVSARCWRVPAADHAGAVNNAAQIDKVRTVNSTHLIMFEIYPDERISSDSLTAR
jgi:hypothetical protein